MACYHPRTVWMVPGDRIVFRYPKNPLGPVREFQIPCRTCIGCRMSYAREWATRCIHESMMHSRNCFITLTYDQEHCPKNGSLDHRHFQLFMKRLRFHFKNLEIRYYMAGEYGGLNGRPHYHAILFGIDFNDKVFHRMTPARGRLYRSETLSKLWGMGFVSVGSVTLSSALYVAKYCMKKVTGDLAKDHYSRVDLETGEIYQLLPEYNKMSTNPGLGASFLEKYIGEIYPRDSMVVGKMTVKPPRYYDKLLARKDEVAVQWLKANRAAEVREKGQEDRTPERLAVREACHESKYKIRERGKFTYEAA